MTAACHFDEIINFFGRFRKFIFIKNSSQGQLHLGNNYEKNFGQFFQSMSIFVGHFQEFSKKGELLIIRTLADL